MRRTFSWIFVVISLTLASACLAFEDPKSPDELVARMEQAAAGLKDYQVRGQGEAKGKRSRFTMYFLKPNLVRVDSGDGQVSVQPSGQVRGRKGSGLFGKISIGMDRDDKRLRDDEGIPFWEGHYAASVARIREQMKGGQAQLTVQPEGYLLEVAKGNTRWTYRVDQRTLFFLENSRWVNGKQVESTRYSDFRPNSGLKEGRFKF